MNLTDALTSLYPSGGGNVWTITNNDYSTLDWPGTNADSKPTEAALNAEVTALEAVEYKTQRLALYKETSDPILFEWLYLEEKSDAGAAAKRTEWLAAVDQIKADCPKP